MPVDHSLLLRRAVVTHLKDSSAMTAIVDDRIYGDDMPKDPRWPLIRVGEIIAGPYEATCWDGMIATFAVNSFAIGDTAVRDLNATITERLHDAGLGLGAAGHTVWMHWQQTSVVRDVREADARHGIVQFEAATSLNY